MLRMVLLAELDLRLLLCPGSGLEVDLSPGQRVDARVHDRAERPARQLLYVTSGDPRHDDIVRRTAVSFHELIPRHRPGGP